MEEMAYISGLAKSIISNDTFWELFGIAIASGLAAFFGARGAQRIISKEASNLILRQELNLCISALMNCVSIANLVMSVKKQHIDTMKNDYDVEVNKAVSAIEKSTKMIHVNVDLKTLTLPNISTKYLEKIMNGDVLLTGRAFGALNSLYNSIELLKSSMDGRNEIINSYKYGSIPKEIVTLKYLGMDTQEGKDETYKDFIDCIYLYSMDVIFFAIVLAEDLNSISEKKLKKLKKRDISPKIPKVNWNSEGAILPKQEDYVDWLKGFPDAPQLSTIP